MHRRELRAWTVGEEVFRSIAEATVRNQPPPRTMPKAELDERISAAEAVLPLLNDVERVRQIRRIAGLKRARTLGVAGLSKAAIAAQRTRRANAMAESDDSASRFCPRHRRRLLAYAAVQRCLPPRLDRARGVLDHRVAPRGRRARADGSD